MNKEEQKIESLPESDDQDVIDLNELLKPENLFRDSSYIRRNAMPMEPLWGTFLYKKAITLIVGDPGIGKTTLGYDLCGTLCLGEAFLGIKAEEPIRALYMDWESADSLVSSRMGVRFEEQDITNLFIYNSEFTINKIYPQIIDFCRKKKVNFVVVDNQTTAFDTRDENDNSEAAKQMRMLRKFVNATKCSLLVFHHPSKSNSPGIRKGTGAFARARLADICFNVNLTSEEETNIIYIEQVKNRLYDGEKIKWFVKKDGGRFTMTEPTLGFFGTEPNTQIYKATSEVLAILGNGTNQEEGIKFQVIATEMIKRGYSEIWADKAIQRLSQQNRVWKPKYGYWAIRRFIKKPPTS